MAVKQIALGFGGAESSGNRFGVPELAGLPVLYGETAARTEQLAGGAESCRNRFGISAEHEEIEAIAGYSDTHLQIGGESKELGGHPTRPRNFRLRLLTELVRLTADRA